jgi:CRAL/TRIO domain
LRHWIFVTEYQWKILAKGDETAKGIAIIDVGTVRMGDLAGDNLDYVKKTIGYANAHYPERSHVIYLVNAPMWFSILWRIVRPLVHPNTQAKVRILTRSDTLAGLQEHIDISNIPEFYGGKLDFGGKDSCRFHSPEVVDMANFVLRVNEGSAEVKSQFDEHAVNASPTPPGKPGELFTPHVGSGSGSSIAHSYSSESFLPDSRNQAVIELNKISGKTPSSPSPLPSPSSSSLRRRKDGGFGDSHGGVYEL